MNDISRLGFGCVQLTAISSARAAQNLLSAVFDLGIRHFDTAPIYGQGYSEKIIGRFLKGRREKVSIATKFGLRPSTRPTLYPDIALPLNALRKRYRAPPEKSVRVPVDPHKASPVVTTRITKSDLQRDFSASCQAMSVDYIDLYLLHEHLPRSLDDDALQYLFWLKSSGQVGALGLAANGSNYLSLKPSNVTGWDVLQYEGGPAWPAHASLLRMFSEQTHNFHSCFKDVPRGNSEVFGSRLRSCLRENPSGRVIFGSTSLRHVLDNLSVIDS
jgi:hypothetical protein